MSKLVILGIGGDSITGCTDVGIDYPYQALGVTGVGNCASSFTQSCCTYYASVGGLSVVAKNLGVGGTRLTSTGGPDNMTSVAQTYGDPMITANGSPVAGGGTTAIPSRVYVYSLLAGSNDGCLDLGSVSGYVADVVTFVAARKAAGWTKVIIGTVLPRSDSGGPMTDANRLAYNGIITASGWAGANGVDGIFDFGSNSTMGNISTCSNTTYYNTDQIHPTTTGHAILAPIWLATFSTVVATL